MLVPALLCPACILTLLRYDATTAVGVGFVACRKRVGRGSCWVCLFCVIGCCR